MKMPAVKVISLSGCGRCWKAIGQQALSFLLCCWSSFESSLYQAFNSNLPVRWQGRLDAFILIRACVLQWFHVLSTIQDSNCWALHHLLENEFTWPLWPESHESIKPPPSLPSLVDRHAAMILLLTSNEYRAPSLQMTVGGLEMPQRTRS